ncbi:hypothetical protein CRE_22778 [Caenorhabditis remanei]|uniref:G-protein coupled receptors family 1 profile domain-containing protein n=1 Tax=Caenorhabditis remanei TaxID=31234 RepID=E3MHG1_CAERE|nr:hypothetical protein CRE_22778 [Caenorhabditis remanei]
MYISWTHFYIPKLFAGLAFLVNPIFVYLIFTEKSNKFGNYRFLLLYFAIFNLVYSMFTILVPISTFSLILGFQDIHSYRYCFFVFLSDGWFLEASEIGFHLLSARCSLISGSYAVLLTHFIYRYLAIRNSFIATRFKLYMAGTLILFLVYFGTWNVIVQTLGWTSGEVNTYIQTEFLEIYGIESPNVNIISMLYNVSTVSAQSNRAHLQEASSEVILRSWVVLISLTIISLSSILSYFVLGYLTIKKLNENAIQFSQKTANLQKDLLKALSVQTIIPICVSFCPCVICWYSPIFNINSGR